MTNDENNSRISEDFRDTETAKPPPDRVDPLAMTIAQAAKVLSAVGGGTVTEELLRRHITEGAPVTSDGRINLVHYAAWLNKEMARDNAD
ncbi:MAG: hypothetical protein HZA50_17625 [Planctomycetes bacterium]|nr:hypothetical protein [Planctomycetota bacterium]